MKLYEHVQHVSVKFVLKLFKLFQSNLANIKLARDALKELIETNSSKYAFEVATHLNVPLQDKLVRVLFLFIIKNHEVGPVFPFRSAGRVYP